MSRTDAGPAKTGEPPGTVPDGRRRFLRTALAGLATLFAASLALPLFRFLWPPARTAGGEGRIGIPLDEFLVGQSRIVSIRGEPVLVVRDGGKVVALSAVCTHLGCLVRYKGGGVVLCPCHAGSFDLNGNVTGGPAARPLTSYPVRIEGGMAVVGA